MTRKVWLWLLAGTVFLAFIATLVLAPFTRSLTYWPWLLPPVVAMFMGALILTRASGNLVGRLMMALGVSMVGGLFFWSLVDRFGTTEQGAWAEAIASGIGTAGIQFMPLTVLRFPDAKPVTPRWRVAEGLTILTMATGFTAALLNSGFGGDISGATAPSPLRDVTFPWGDWLAAGFIALALTSLAATALSVVVRFRRSRGEQRQQLKFLLLTAALPLGSMILAGGTFDQIWENVVGAVGFLVVPIAIAAAVLRYRLYEVDVVINRTVLFVVLAGFITAVYALVVVGLGRVVGSQLDLGLSIVATAVVAFAFEPVRVKAQRWANRIAYGNRATPYEVLSDLTQRLSTTESAQGLLDRIARRLADGTGAERAAIWTADGDSFHPAGIYPPPTDLPHPAGFDQLPGQVAAITTNGQTMGALTVEKRRGDPLTPQEQRLIDDLAGSSASILQNLGLQTQLTARAQELETSRRRLVDVQHLERQRMERDLDEGAQQLVVSLKVKLNVAARIAKAEGAQPLQEMLDGMDNEARQAITQIRTLARGLYPPLLEAEGLASAVRSLADQAAVPVEVEASGIDRFAAELEATAFFCISEAVTNAAKHAPGRPVRVRLARSNGQLEFEISDQGPGFDQSGIQMGSGLRNMADRIDAVGGRFAVASAPGQGTRITGTIPVPEEAQAHSAMADPASK